MHKPLRDAIAVIKNRGGKNIRIVHESRHTLVEFDNGDERKFLRIHQGSKVDPYFMARVRAQLNRTGLERV